MLTWIWILSFALAGSFVAFIIALYALRALKETLDDSYEYEDALERTVKAFKRSLRASEKHRAALERIITIQESIIATHQKEGVGGASKRLVLQVGEA